jgi:hypothetical protein
MRDTTNITLGMRPESDYLQAEAHAASLALRRTAAELLVNVGRLASPGRVIRRHPIVTTSVIVAASAIGGAKIRATVTRRPDRDGSMRLVRCTDRPSIARSVLGLSLRVALRSLLVRAVVIGFGKLPPAIPAGA